MSPDDPWLADEVHLHASRPDASPTGTTRRAEIPQRHVAADGGRDGWPRFHPFTPGVVMPSTKFNRDLAERAGWTAAQAAVGVLITAEADLPPGWAVLLATVAAIIKCLAARRVGDPDSGSTLQEDTDGEETGLPGGTAWA